MSEDNKKPAIGPSDYASALFAQDACNLPAILKTFADVAMRIGRELESTSKVYDHPIIILYTNKIESLVHSDKPFARYSNAYEACKDRSNGS